jgi:hypothetical protein
VGKRPYRIVQWEMRAQFLNGELFYTLKEAQILTQQWRIPYNTLRPHRVEPISKLLKEHRDAGELHKAQEV